MSARHEILQAANKQRQRTNVAIINAAERTRKPLQLLPPIRSMPEAVCIVRRHRLVSPDVLVAAGFAGAER